MLLYRSIFGPVLFRNDEYLLLEDRWGSLLTRDDLPEYLAQVTGSPTTEPKQLLSLCSAQEVWAAGVTYYRSRTARMEESKDAGGGSFYDRVYSADRPEIFFKASPHRVAGPGQPMHLRRDSKWMVPEPELTLVVSPGGKLIGTTVGNDLSCRDIEGENPLYLPQAKSFKLSAALGPCIRVSSEPLAPDTTIHLAIQRSDAVVFTSYTTLAQLKRTADELIGWLFRDNDFPHGVFLMTGTGIVPPDDFTLQLGDEVRITIQGIGTLVNRMG
jgi:2-dehydro-3-deoxy-D-arabinonate dehydratase